jgi:hypothetical protein
MYAYSWMVTEFALGGLTKSYTVEDLVKGYVSTTTENFNNMGSISSL